jgi:hypothetical protein
VRVVLTAEPVTVIAAGIAQVGGLTAPGGPPVTAQLVVTCPVKPPLGEIATVELPPAPGDAMVIAVLLRVKPGGTAGTGTLTAKLVAALTLPAVPVTVTV